MPMIQKTKPTSMTEVNSELYKSNMWRPQADFKTGGSDVVAMNAIQEGKSSGQRLAETLGLASGLVKESAVAAATVQKYSSVEGTKIKASIIGFGNAYQSALKEQNYFLGEAEDAKRQELVSNLRDSLYVQYLGDYAPEDVKKHQRVMDATLGETQLYMHQANQKALIGDINSANSVVLSDMTNRMLKHIQTVDSYGKRPNGTAKGDGWLGPIPLTNADGSTGVMTEVTIGTELDGKQYDMPLLVPGLTKNEVKAVGDFVTSPNKTPEEKQAAWEALPDSVKRKSTEHLISSLKGEIPLYAPFTPEKDIRQAYSDYYEQNIKGKPGDPGRDAYARMSINILSNKMYDLAAAGDLQGANRLLKAMKEKDNTGISWEFAVDNTGKRKFGTEIDAAESNLITMTKTYAAQQEKDKTDTRAAVKGDLMVMAFDQNTDTKTFQEKLQGEQKQGNITADDYSTLMQTFYKAKNGGLREDSLDTVLSLRWKAQDGGLTEKGLLEMVRNGTIQSQTTINNLMSDIKAYKDRMAKGDKEGESFYKKEANIYLDSLKNLKQTFDIKLDPDGASKVNSAMQYYQLEILRNKVVPSVAYDAALKRFGIKTYQETPTTPKAPTTPLGGNPAFNTPKATQNDLAKKGVQLLNAK